MTDGVKRQKGKEEWMGREEGVGKGGMSTGEGKDSEEGGPDRWMGRGSAKRRRGGGRRWAGEGLATQLSIPGRQRTHKAAISRATLRMAANNCSFMITDFTPPD